MDPGLNVVRGNTSLQIRSNFQEGGGWLTTEPMVEFRIVVSRSRIHHPGRFVEVESQPDVFGFHLPLSELFPPQFRRLQVERMLSHVGHPHRSDIDFWTDQISSYASQVAHAVALRGYSSASMVVKLNILEQFSDSREVEPVIDEESQLSLLEAAGEDLGEAERVTEEDLRLLAMEDPAGTGEEFGAVPASESSIKALETKRYRGDGKDASTCAVCLEDFQAGDELTVMPCSHGFHQSCATKWLEQSNTCPLCRCAMPTVDGERC